MALRNNKKRFTDAYPRHAWVYGDVKDYLNGFGGKDEFARYVSGILSWQFGADHLQEHSIEGNTKHGIVYGAATLGVGSMLARAIYRKKSDESGADKVMRTAETLGVSLKQSVGIPVELMPPDVLGMTVVTRSMQELVKAHSLAVAGIHRSGALFPVTDPTKTFPHTIDGSDEFREGFFELSRLRSLPRDKYNEQPNIRGFNAVRTLFRYQVWTQGGLWLPVDEHFQREEDRKAARTGPANHSAYSQDKNGKKTNPNCPTVETSVPSLVSIKTRAQHMGSDIFVRDSEQRTTFFHARVATAEKVDLFRR